MPYHHFWLLLVWMILGTVFRFINLGELPPWTDEFATMVFSLGNSFYDVPLNQFIDFPTLMAPLQLNSQANISDVADLLLTESTHPPLFFVLTHWWLKLFPAADGLVSVWAARSLSAGLGVLAIPAIFGLTRLISPSFLTAHLAAGMMAISPFSIFVSTQARHYTLIILLVMATLSCFIVACGSLRRSIPIPLPLVFLWIVINCLAVASHYFFVLTLASMAIALIPLAWQDWQLEKRTLCKSKWRRLYVVILGSLAGCLAWLPSLLAVRDSSPTEWIYASNAADKWLEPIGRFLLWLMSTVTLLPSSLYDFPLGVVIVAGILTLIFWVMFLPSLVREIKLQRSKPESNVASLVTYLFAVIALFFIATYFWGMDLTLAARFQFIYFPVVLILIAIAIEKLWSKNWSYPNRLKLSTPTMAYFPRQAIVVLFFAVAIISGTVANLNRGYLQNHRPDLAIAEIVAGTEAPLAIATTFIHHGQTGRIMGLAWGLREFPQLKAPQFFLASDFEGDEQNNSTQILAEQLLTIPRPLDLWLINFRTDHEQGISNCQPDSQYQGTAGQYKYELYRCRK